MVKDNGVKTHSNQNKAGRIYRNSKLGVPTIIKMRKVFYDRKAMYWHYVRNLRSVQS